MQELLREAQKVYMRRDEEQQKLQAKVLVAAVRKYKNKNTLETPHGQHKGNKEEGGFPTQVPS